MEPAGQDLGAPLAPEINGSLARDRFDSDCVLGTQFEVLSAPPRILVLTEISRFSAISPELAGLFSETLSLPRCP